MTDCLYEETGNFPIDNLYCTKCGIGPCDKGHRYGDIEPPEGPKTCDKRIPALTKLQVGVLEAVCFSPSGHSCVGNLAYLLQKTKSAVGRAVLQLSALDLVRRQRFNKGWEIWPTEAGRKHVSTPFDEA